MFTKSIFLSSNLLTSCALIESRGLGGMLLKNKTQPSLMSRYQSGSWLKVNPISSLMAPLKFALCLETTICTVFSLHCA